jgi:hypothetical protein
MFLSAYLLTLLAQPVGVAPRDEIKVDRGAQTLDLSWSDAEDRIQGTISPRDPVAGQPVDVSAHVGAFAGAEFDGPVTFAWKESRASGGGETKTVTRGAGEKAWRAQFVPPEAGEYQVEISFRTNHLKVAKATVSVEQAKLPRWPWWILVGVMSIAALGFGVRSVLKKAETA